MTTAVDADTDVQVGKTLLSKDQNGLKGLEAQSLGLDQLQGNTIHTDHATASLAVSHGRSRFLHHQADQGTEIYLFSVGLDGLHSTVFRYLNGWMRISRPYLVGSRAYRGCAEDLTLQVPEPPLTSLFIHPR